MVALLATKLSTTQVATINITILATLIIFALATFTTSIPLPFLTYLRTIISTYEGSKPLMLVTLYDYYFHLPYAKNKMKSHSCYIFMLHNDFIPLYVSSPSIYLGSHVNLMMMMQLNRTTFPVGNPRVVPFT